METSKRIKVTHYPRLLDDPHQHISVKKGQIKQVKFLSRLTHKSPSKQKQLQSRPEKSAKQTIKPLKMPQPSTDQKASAQILLQTGAHREFKELQTRFQISIQNQHDCQLTEESNAKNL